MIKATVVADSHNFGNRVIVNNGTIEELIKIVENCLKHDKILTYA